MATTLNAHDPDVVYALIATAGPTGATWEQIQQASGVTDQWDLDRLAQTIAGLVFCRRAEVVSPMGRATRYRAVTR